MQSLSHLWWLTGTASLCLEVYFNLHTLSCVSEDLLESWPVFIEIKGYNKILQHSEEPASWPGTELCLTHVCKAQVLCVSLRKGRNAAVTGVSLRSPET